jgi:hypothetical protein
MFEINALHRAIGMFRPLCVVAVILVLAACAPSVVAPELQAHAEKYFVAIEKGDVDGALKLYDPDFYKVTSVAQWKRILERVEEKLGKMQSYKLVGWRVNSRIGSGSGVYAELSYEVKYEKYPAHEVIVVRQLSSGGGPGIISHNINSVGLLLE